MYNGERRKAERINERLSSEEISINQARNEYGFKPIPIGEGITKVLPDSNKELD